MTVLISADRHNVSTGLDEAVGQTEENVLAQVTHDRSMGKAEKTVDSPKGTCNTVPI